MPPAQGAAARPLQGAGAPFSGAELAERTVAGTKASATTAGGLCCPRHHPSAFSAQPDMPHNYCVRQVLVVVLNIYISEN